MSGDAELHTALGELADITAAAGDETVVAVIGVDRRVIYTSGLFYELSEFPPDARGEDAGVPQLLVSSLHPPEFFEKMWRTVAGGDVWQGSIQYVSRSGRNFSLSTTLVPVLGRDGTPHRYMAVCYEEEEPVPADEGLSDALHELAQFTERQRRRADRLEREKNEIARAHAAMARSEKLSSLGLLASSLAHEINNPLSGVMACVKALREGTVPVARRSEYFDTINEALDRIRGAVGALLSYARPERTGAQIVDVVPVVQSCLTLIAPVLGRASVTVDLRIRPGEFTVRASKSELMQAAMNVLLNAVHASPPGSVITIRAWRTEQAIALSFQDEGRGIPADVLPHVCEPFFTTKEDGEGTGLGLSITEGILAANGGRLELASTEGQGTTITFHLKPAS